MDRLQQPRAVQMLQSQFAPQQQQAKGGAKGGASAKPVQLSYDCRRSPPGRKTSNTERLAGGELRR
jgi:hypothetical protein